MGVQLADDKIAEIKAAFENMQSRDDLLNLLNLVTEIQSNWFRPGLKLVPIFRIKIGEDGDITFTKSEKENREQLITRKQLDFFSTSFEGKDKKRSRYTRFYVRKKSGTLREIKAPLPKLKEIQRAVNFILQTVYTVQEQAFGFVPGKNITDNARMHEGASFILNVDVKDFFPSVHFRRVKLMLEKPPFNLTGEKEPLAFLIANLCTEDGTLPQGAPTSPLFTNIVCQRLDRRLQAFALQYKAAYSRYADDITFSCSEYIFTRRFMLRLEKILKDDRFEINPEKTRIQGKAFRQEVTGLTVNEKVNVSRHFYRSYRTLLHLYTTKGANAALEYHIKRMPESVALIKLKNGIKNPDTYIQNVIWGKFQFLNMVKRVLKPPSLFVKEPPVNKVVLPLISFKMKPEDYPTSEELLMAAEDAVQYTRATSEAESIESNQSTVPQSEISFSSANLIEMVLSEWENNLSGDGFEKAMEILKQQSNE